jgi:hypothetical protein
VEITLVHHSNHSIDIIFGKSIRGRERKKDKLKILPSGQIGDVDEGVVEGSVDVGNTEDLLAFANLGSEGHLDLLNLLLLSFAGGHFRSFFQNLFFEKIYLLSEHAGNVGKKKE